MEINDNIILLMCFKKDNSVNPNSYKNNIEILNYLKNRYNDIPEKLFSYSEVIYRIKNHIESRPTCQICGNPVKFTHRIKNINTAYTTICSKKCKNKNSSISLLNFHNELSDKQKLEIKEKSKASCLKKYGVEYSFLSQNNKDKSNKTRKERYGDENFGKFGSDSFKEKMKMKYGYEYPQSADIVKNKISESLSSFEVQEKMKATCKEKYGVEYISLNEDIKKEIYQTYKNHQSYKTSLQEILFYEILKTYYTDIIHFYKSDEYPFNCDFFIPLLTLYIECNFHYTHYMHHYNEQYDKDILLYLINKNYTDTIKIWKDKDPIKLNVAKTNKINYLVIYRFFHNKWKNLCYYIKNEESKENQKNIIGDFLYNYIENNYRNKNNIQLLLGEKYE